MAKLEVVRAFRGTCLICRCMPVDETKESRPPLPMIRAHGVDVNWGEDLNICMVCAGVMADLLGRPDEVKVQRVQRELTSLRDEHETLTHQHSRLEERVARMLDGRKAVKEHRDERKGS